MPENYQSNFTVYFNDILGCYSAILSTYNIKLIERTYDIDLKTLYILILIFKSAKIKVRTNKGRLKCYHTKTF